MRHASELEQMVNLLALTADVMRKLARQQEGSDHQAIHGCADELEGVAGRLVDILFPPDDATRDETRM